MRSEVVLILWVMASFSSAWVLSGGGVPGNFVPSTSPSKDDNRVMIVDETPAAAPQAPKASVVDGLLSVSADERLLFSADAAVSVDADIADAPVAKEFGYMLRGIVRANDSWRAIFEGGDGQSQYLVVGLGESIGEFEVAGLEADRVLLRSLSGGSERVLMLRGTGETP